MRSGAISPIAALLATVLAGAFVVNAFGISSGINVDPKEGKAEKPGNTATTTTTSDSVVCSLPPVQLRELQNSTQSRFHVFNCNRELPIQIISARVVNARTNAIIYPLSNSEPIVLVVTISNNKGVTITDEQFLITISEWGSDANGECGWKPVNTKGVFDNFNGCAFAHDCPVPKGASQIRIPLHLEKFAPVISQLQNGFAYQLELHIINTSNRTNVSEVGCAIAQGRVA